MKITVLLFFILFFSLTGIAIAQRDIEYRPTEKTYSKPPYNAKKAVKKPRKIRYIVKKDTQGTLMGNKCYEDATLKMGYLYVIVPKGQPGNKNNWQRFWANTGVKTIIFFKNGPFWKSRENKYFKKCKYGTGDYVG